MKQYPIPPIVQNLLERLWNEQLDKNERDNVAMTLDEIERAVHSEISQYRRGRARDHREDREAKRKQRSSTSYARVSR